MRFEVVYIFNACYGPHYGVLCWCVGFFQAVFDEDDVSAIDAAALCVAGAINVLLRVDERVTYTAFHYGVS